jgi:integrase
MEELFTALRSAGVVGSLARQCRRVLSGAFKHAVKRGLIRESPLAHVERPRVPDNTVEVFTAEDSRAILASAWCGKYAALRRRHAALFSLAFATCMRRGELLGVEWPYLDAGAGTLRVAGAGLGQGQTLPQAAQVEARAALGQPAPVRPHRPCRPPQAHGRRGPAGWAPLLFAVRLLG